MARIEISGTPDELERIGTFLKNNNVDFKMVNDFANYSLEEQKMFDRIIEKFK
ncbi:hypothetical protein [Maribacter halichondriae]|uniref:hypothetical protein n=1 Tax=Maribacter halichondriae TaxID=2980554 RepID=UPI002358BB8C|nr:hypothetical protein [Maribacter sp. Hal144]